MAQANSEYSEVADRMQSSLAMTHHIQTRIAGALSNGRVSVGVAKEIASLCDGVADQFAAAARKDGGA